VVVFIQVNPGRQSGVRDGRELSPPQADGIDSLWFTHKKPAVPPNRLFTSYGIFCTGRPTPMPTLPVKKTILRNLLLLLLLGVAVYFFLPRLASLEHALRVVSKLNVPFVLLAVVSEVLSYLGSGYLLQTVVNKNGRPLSIADGTLMNLGANSVGTLGGGVLGTAGMTFLFLHRRGVDHGTAGLGGWLPIYLNNTVLAALSLPGLFVLMYLKKSSHMMMAGFILVGLVLGAGLGVLVWILLRREKLHAIGTSIAGFFSKFRHKPVGRTKIRSGVSKLLKSWDALVQGGWRGPVVGALLNNGFDLLCLYFLFLAAGYHVRPAVLLAGYGIPQLLGKLTVILGGVGVVESGMVGLYVLLGVPKTGAVIVVLVYRLLSFWLPTLIGIALVPYLERQGRRTK